MKKWVCLLVMGIMLGQGSLALGADGKTPTIFHITVTDADTEYSQLISPHTKKIKVQNQGANDIRIAYESGKVATPTAPYWTLKSGSVYEEDNLKIRLGVTTLYVASGSATQTIEVLVWR